MLTLLLNDEQKAWQARKPLIRDNLYFKLIYHLEGGYSMDIEASSLWTLAVDPN